MPPSDPQNPRTPGEPERPPTLDAEADHAHEAWEHATRAREHGRQLRAESEALIGDLEAGLRGQLARNPYAVLGAAAAAGYVLSAGVPRWAVRLAVSAGSRWLIDAALGQIIASVPPPAPAPRRRR